MAKAGAANKAGAMATKRPRGRGLQPRSLRGTRGAVLVEYALLLVGVAIPVVAGIITAGAIMLAQYQSGRDSILQPYP
jgi:Flp pilus assembly pilin Flp